MNKLTIAIPTYNRPEKLLSVIKDLLPQIENQPVSIVIVDNASLKDISNLLIEQQITSTQIQVYRNKINIGLGPNLIKAIESSEADWIWLLGDDDIPKEDSVKRILKDISKIKDNICLIKYNSDAGAKVDKEYLLKGTKDVSQFIKDIRIYSNVLFISNSIFYKEAIFQQIHTMYKYAGSMAPHIPAIIAAVKNEYGIIWYPEEIIKHGIPENINESWDWHKLKAGFLTLSDIDFDDNFRDIAMPSINKGYVGEKFFKEAFLAPFKTRKYSYQYWKQYYFRTASLYKGIKMIYLIFLGIIIKYIFKINVINTYLTKRFHKQTDGSLERS